MEHGPRERIHALLWVTAVRIQDISLGGLVAGLIIAAQLLMVTLARFRTPMSGIRVPQRILVVMAYFLKQDRRVMSQEHLAISQELPLGILAIPIRVSLFRVVNRRLSQMRIVGTVGPRHIIAITAHGLRE